MNEKGNPLWIPGQSGNPKGRPPAGAITTRGRLQRIINNEYTPKKLKGMFGVMTVKEKIDFLTAILPYILPRRTADTISNEEIDKLYNMIVDSQKGNRNAV